MNFPLSTAQSIASTSLPPFANSNSLSQQSQMEAEISTGQLEQFQTPGSLPASLIQQQRIAEDPQQQQPMPGISISNQNVQHPQFTKPGAQTQRQTNFDAAGKSGFKESTATSQQRQPDQAQQAQLLSQQQQQEQNQEQGQIVGGASQMDVTSQPQQVSLQQQQQQQQQQAVRGVQQQQPPLPKVVWSGIMEFTEVVSLSELFRYHTFTYNYSEG